MKNLFMPVLIIALTVGFGCKNMFQEKSLVGKWREVKHYDPNKGKWEDSTDKKDQYYELFENGDIGTESGKKAKIRLSTLNSKKSSK